MVGPAAEHAASMRCLLTACTIVLLLGDGGVQAIRGVLPSERSILEPVKLLPNNNNNKADINDRPIVGILSQPGSPAPEGQSYIAASYVKWVESAGARVVPIFYDMTDAQIVDRFNIVNAVLLPGGGATLSPGHRFYDAARLLVDLAVAANENGDYFPVHGTCLGMETLSVIISRNYTILSSFDAEDAPAALLYTEDAEASHLLRSLPPIVVHDLQNSPIAMENHQSGLSMNSFWASARLSDFFKVLSLSLDKKGSAYISTMESKRYPITATQWHPEKNSFEWAKSLHIPHSPKAITMAQEIANFFVSEARRNSHRSNNTDQEDDLLIYNWLPHFSGRHVHGGEEQDFEQVFIFGAPPPPPSLDASGK